MEQAILFAGEAMLMLAAVASCVALVCAIIWMLRWLVRTVRAMGRLPDGTVYRPSGGVRGSARKW